MKANLLVKIENGEQSFIAIDEHGCVYDMRFLKDVTDRDITYFKKAAFVTEPCTMINSDQEEFLSLPSEVHRLSRINNNKPEARFTVQSVTVDFSTMQMTVIEQWDFDVKQWPEGHIRITKTK